MRGLNEKDLQDLEQVIREKVPGFEVRFKEDSTLMSLIGTFSCLFNDQFMTRYTTTMGRRVYFPSRVHYTENPARSIRILCHELVHLCDGQDHWYFKLSYLMPHLLVVIPLVLYMALAWPHVWLALLPLVAVALGSLVAKLSKVAGWVVLIALLGGVGTLSALLVGWWSFVLLSVIVPLLPWPSPWRTGWELRGYGMNIAMTQWLYGKVSEEQLQRSAQEFTGPSYYFMSWSSGQVLRNLRWYGDAAKDPAQLGEPYEAIHRFIRS